MGHVARFRREKADACPDGLLPGLEIKPGLTAFTQQQVLCHSRDKAPRRHQAIQVTRELLTSRRLTMRQVVKIGEAGLLFNLYGCAYRDDQGILRGRDQISVSLRSARCIEQQEGSLDEDR